MKYSLGRALPRMVVMFVVGLVLALLAHLPELGHQGPIVALVAPFCYVGSAFTFGLLLIDALLRIMQPDVDAQEAANDAVSNYNVASGLVYLGRCILIAVFVLAFSASVRAAEPPEAARPLLPILKEEQRIHWPTMPNPPVLGAQVEQETCITLKHRSCWNPRAELRTSRERGLGLGQFTIAWRTDGSVRFDALSELRAKHADALSGLSWERPYEPRLQLRAMVLKGRDDFRSVVGAANDFERLAMSKAAYNGGMGGLASDRRICAATAGCRPDMWFDHVERTSAKSKVAAKGYGKSFFQINREYVRNVMLIRVARYGSLA